ncbi:MAG: TolC family protein [Sumerlaeia bacterium]
MIEQQPEAASGATASNNSELLQESETETIQRLEALAREGRLPSYEDLRLSSGSRIDLTRVYINSLPLMTDDAPSSEVVFAELNPNPEFAELLLEDLLQLSFERNFSLINSRRSLLIQESGVRSAQGEFVPFIDWVSEARAERYRDFETPVAGNPNRETKSETYSYDLSTGVELTQNLPTGGSITGDFTEGIGESRTTSGQNGISESNSYDAGGGVRFSQPLLQGSGLLTGEGSDIGTANLRRSRLDRLDSELQNRLNERDTALRVIRQYFSILQSKQQLIVSRDAILERYRFLDETRVYFEVGRVAESEILRAQIQFLQEVERAINRQQQLDDAREQLLSLLGLPLETPLSLVDITSLVTDRGAFAIPPVQEALALARVNRLELMRQELTIEQNLINQQLAENAILADLDFDVGVRYFDTGDNFRDANDLKQDRIDAGISLRVPLSNRIRTREAIRQSSIRLDQARTNLLSQQRDIDQEVLSAHRDVLTTEARLTVLRKQVEQARRNLELIKGSFEVGFATVTEVRLAQDDLFNTETSYKNALLGYQVSIAELYVAMGMPLL